MKVTINHHCSGHARCFELAPDVYEIDDNGYNSRIGETIEIAPGREDAALVGVHSCPELALVVEGNESERDHGHVA